jgi:hypothetical protein
MSHHESKKDFYIFIVLTFFLNLIIISFLVIFTNNFLLNLENGNYNIELKQDLKSTFQSLETKYYQLPKSNPLASYENIYNKDINIPDIVDNLRQVQFVTGAELIDVVVVNSTESEIELNITLSGTFNEIANYIEEVEKQGINQTTDYELLMDNGVNYILNSKLIVYKSKIK